jgi:hypothetical protein
MAFYLAIPGLSLALQPGLELANAFGVVLIKINTGLRILGHAWERERERHTRTVIRSGPETTTIVLDDRAADGETDSHAVSFGCVEGAK